MISLHGSYFGNNYGDILLVALFAQWIKEVCPDYVINLPLAQKSKTKELPDGTTGLINLIRSKCLVFCGGGYFGEQPINKFKWSIRNFYRHGIVGLLAIIFNIPYAIVGVEFGPLSVNWIRHVFLLIAKHSKVIVVRNEESKVFLEKYGIKNVILAVDAVLALNKDEYDLKQSHFKSAEILLHIPGIAGHSDHYLDLVDKIITSIKKRKTNHTIGLINDTYEAIYENDSYRCIIRAISENGIPFAVHSYNGYNNLINLISKSSCIITTKLHVGITAAALGIRPLSYWLHPKTKRFYEQIGNADFCFPVDGVIDETIIDEYLNQDNCFSIPLAISSRASLNKQILKEFLETYIPKQ